MYKNLKQLMDEAQALDYTVGAFNAHNLETVSYTHLTLPTKA